MTKELFQLLDRLPTHSSLTKRTDGWVCSSGDLITPICKNPEDAIESMILYLDKENLITQKL